MKTTLEIDDQLLLTAKQRALDTGSSLREVVESALSQLLKPARKISSPIKTVIFTPAVASESSPPNSKELLQAAYPAMNASYSQKRLGNLGRAAGTAPGKK